MGHKLKFVLSDLHLGAGHSSQEIGPLEDFTATEELIAFLQEITEESEQYKREIELIFNGDLFELLQVPATDNYDPTYAYSREAYLDSSEAASIKRLKIIVAGHQEIFNALSDFMHVKAPQRRITIIKGNRDICLFWPRVKSYLREVLGASGARASLLRFADEFVSREKIYVEHGHQRAEKMNGYHDSFNPRSTDDPTQLFYPAGSHFVIDFFNRVEPEHHFVDHIKPLTSLIWYAFQWDFDFAGQALACFIRKTPALVISDVNYLKDNFISPTDTLLETLENTEKRQELAVRYKTDPAFRYEFHQQIHQYLDDASINNKGNSNLLPLVISDNPIEMGRANQERQRIMLRQAAKEITDQEKADVIIFGHTHEPTKVALDNGSLYINTGSWIKDLSHISSEKWAALFNGEPIFDELPHRLPYARIDYDHTDRPHAELLTFAYPIDAEKKAGADEHQHPVKSSRALKRRLERLIRRFGTNESHAQKEERL